MILLFVLVTLLLKCYHKKLFNAISEGGERRWQVVLYVGKKGQLAIRSAMLIIRQRGG